MEAHAAVIGSQKWRLNHLYHIINEQGQDVLFFPCVRHRSVSSIPIGEMDQLTIGTFSRAYISGQLVNARVIFPEGNKARNGTHRIDLEGDGHATYTVRNGKMNGPYREYDAQGQQILEIPMLDNHAQGVGWQRRDGKVHQIEFRNGSSVDYLRGRIRFPDKIRD